MQEGWECKKCHNIYSPNTPFCLFCWFQSQNNMQTMQPIVEKQSEIIQVTDEIEDTPSPVINVQPEVPVTPVKILTTTGKPVDETITHNKNLYIPPVDIELPQLNKLPNHPIPNKFPDTKIFLAGIGHSKERALVRKFKIPYVLDSIIDFPVQPSKLVRDYFDYIKKNTDDYLLDSGAFSYMNNPKKSLDLNAHVKQYCYYINEFDIKNFFELDLDVFMSLDEVENIRKKIYLETHKKPIIVYHIERGHDYWINMCKDNEYIAVGGMASAKAKEERWNFERSVELCDEAHSYGTIVHGLGCTPLAILNSHTMCFDTVDSTSWNCTKRGQTSAIGENGELMKLDGTNFFSASEGQENDLRVWAKFSETYYGIERS